MADARRQLTGRRNKKNGDLWEEWICNALENLYTNSAVIEKTPEPFHMLCSGKNGTITGFWKSKAQPDFKGTLKGGQTIVFEAKHTDTDRINQRVVTKPQTDSLEKYYQMGAECCVMVSLGLTRFYRVPWNIWSSMKELFGHKYMSEEELKPYQLKKSGPFVHILDGLEIEE